LARDQATGPGPAAVTVRSLPRRSWKKLLPERVIILGLLVCSAVSIATTVGIVSVLLFEAVLFFQEVSVVEFLTGTRWTPLFASKHFGVLPLVAGTMLTSVLAMLVALPLGLLSAIYLSEYAPDSVRRVLKPILEVLAASLRWCTGISPCCS